jgi:membrane-bound lytic murein transglycosylase B
LNKVKITPKHSGVIFLCYNKGMKTVKKISWFSLVIVLAIFGFSVLKTSSVMATSSTENVVADTSELQDKLDATQEKIDAAQKQLNAAQALLSKNQVQVSTTKNILSKTELTISQKETEMDNLRKRIELNKEILAEYLRQAYYNDQEDPLVRLAIENNSLDMLVANADQLDNFKEKILVTLDEVKQSSDELVQVKQELVTQKETHLEILNDKLAEQGDLKVEVQDAQDTLANIQKKFAQLQSDLNALLGSNYNAVDIKEAVSFASGKTGVPKGVLYGFLKRETDLGKNTGQCTYADVERVSIPGYKKYGKRFQASIDRLYYREKLFNNIIKELGYKSKKVSCTIPFSSAGPNQGGAMGVAQFMSDTWLAYESRISAQTGHGNPDPWNLTDGVMALAIKVKSAGGTSDSPAAIRRATTSYYGIFSQSYYNTVLYWSKNYKQLL